MFDERTLHVILFLSIALAFAPGSSLGSKPKMPGCEWLSEYDYRHVSFLPLVSTWRRVDQEGPWPIPGMPLERLRAALAASKHARPFEYGRV